MPASISRDAFLRTALLGLANACLWLRFARNAHAEEPTAPASVQAQILTRVLPFDRGFAGRVGDGNVVVYLVEVTGNSDSKSAILHMDKALADVGKVADRPLAVRTVAFTGAVDLAQSARAGGAHVLYLAPGLAQNVSAIAPALVDSGILTFAAVEDFVPNGAVMGVAVVAGKPRMSINLSQARAQKIDFPASVLKLAQVYT